MDTKRILTGMAVLLTGSAMVQEAAGRELQEPKIDAALVKAEATVNDGLSSAISADLRRVQCFARKVQSNVCDTGPVFDTHFQVAVIGSGGGIAHKAKTKTSPTGGCSGFATVQRVPVNNANLLAFHLITEADGPGFEDYSSVIQCVKANDAAATTTIDLLAND